MGARATSSKCNGTGWASSTQGSRRGDRNRRCPGASRSCRWRRQPHRWSSWSIVQPPRGDDVRRAQWLAPDHVKLPRSRSGVPRDRGPRALPRTGRRGSRSSSTTTRSTGPGWSRCTRRCSKHGLESPGPSASQEWKPGRSGTPGSPRRSTVPTTASASRDARHADRPGRVLVPIAASCRRRSGRPRDFPSWSSRVTGEPEDDLFLPSPTPLRRWSHAIAVRRSRPPDARRLVRRPGAGRRT